MGAIGEQMRCDAKRYGSVSKITRIYPSKADVSTGSAHESIIAKSKRQADIMFADIANHAVRVAPVEKFALLIDLGVITVSKKMSLDAFFEYQDEMLYDYHKSIGDENFPNPTCILRPGDKLRVRVFQQIVPGKTTARERMTFLEEQRGNLYVGAQGIAHVLEQLGNRLPAGKGYAAFDREDHLWKDPEDNRRVPYVYACSDGRCYFGLGVLESDGYDDDAFFFFSYVSH